MAVSVIKSIYNNLPDDTKWAAEKSFLVSTAIATILSFGKIKLSLEMAAVAYTASLVDSVVSTVLRTYFDVHVLPWYLNYGKLAGSLAFNNFLCSEMFVQKIGIVFSLATCFVADFCTGFKDYDLSSPTLVRNYRWSFLVSAFVSFFKLSDLKMVQLLMGFF